MEKHSIGLPWLLQVRAMYSTSDTKIHVLDSKNNHLFKLQHCTRNTQTNSAPLSIQRVKQRVYYTRRIMGTGWHLTASQPLCRSHLTWKLCRPATCRSSLSGFVAAFSLFCCFDFYYLLVSMGCWNHSVDRQFLFLGAYCKFNLLVGHTGLLPCRCSHSRSPTFYLIQYCYTFAQPRRWNIWKNWVQKVWGIV